MTRTPNSDADVLPLGTAERLLARAAELDAGRRDGVSVAVLRAAAEEAGIARPAFEAALAELGDAHVARGQAARPARPPWWVRVSLAGMIDRRAAMVAYWIWHVAILLAPALVLTLPTGFALRLRVIVALYLMVWSCAAAWVMARAIRWADRSGWDALP